MARQTITSLSNEVSELKQMVADLVKSQSKATLAEGKAPAGKTAAKARGKNAGAMELPFGKKGSTVVFVELTKGMNRAKALETLKPFIQEGSGIRLSMPYHNGNMASFFRKNDVGAAWYGWKA